MNRKYDFKVVKLYIDKEFVDSQLGKFYDVYSPYLDNKVITKVVDADTYDVDLAVEAARRALRYDSEWRRIDKVDRGLFFHRLVDVINRDHDYLTWLEVMDTGRTVTDVHKDIKEMVNILRYYAGYTDKIFGRTMLDTYEDLEFISKEPIGVVGLIGDYKRPMLTFIRKISPVLVTGSTLVYKPSFKTPLATLYLTKLIDEVGFPKGVVNVLTGRGDIVGKAIGMHDHIDHVTFTGRRDIGRLFLDYAGKSNMKGVKLLLDDRSPLIVLKDADIDDAVKIAHHAAFYRDGFTRFKVGRVFVHDDIYDTFLKKSHDLVKRRTFGDIFEDKTHVGHLIDGTRVKKFLDFVDLAKKDGAKILYGGKRYGTTGFVVEPTIITDVTDDMRLLKEDIYGPIEIITRFKTFDDILHWTRKSNYGLGAGIVTRDFDKLVHLTNRLDTGLIWVNTWHHFKPYLNYGSRRLSGDADYLGYDLIKEYLVNKTIHGHLDTKGFTRYFDKYYTL